jgi:TPR repeat protein
MSRQWRRGPLLWAGFSVFVASSALPQVPEKSAEESAAAQQKPVAVKKSVKKATQPRAKPKAKPKARPKAKPVPKAQAVLEPKVDEKLTTHKQSLRKIQAAKRQPEGVAHETAGDQRAALEAFHAAAESGHGEAQRKLGEIYDKGNTAVARDYQSSRLGVVRYATFGLVRGLRRTG